MQSGNLCAGMTTSERFGRKIRKTKRTVSEATDDSSAAMSTTTSMLAERLVEDIGGRPDVGGSCLAFKNCRQFCNESMSKEDVGFQEQIVKELFANQKERHGYEEDWGLVVMD